MFTYDREEETTGQHDSTNGEDKGATIKGGQEIAAGEAEGAEEDEDEDEVEVPDTIPEDAYFIPLGFARQRPQTYYKGSDPEWQSFLEFSKDKKRSSALRSKPYEEAQLHLRS